MNARREPQAALDPPTEWWGNQDDHYELTDEELCESMADQWVLNGGDVYGFDRFTGEIRGWIVAKCAERGMK